MAEKALKLADSTRKRTRSSKDDCDSESTPTPTADIGKGGDTRKLINDNMAQWYDKIQAEFTQLFDKLQSDFAQKLEGNTKVIEAKMEEEIGKLQEQVLQLQDIIKDLKKEPIQLNLPPDKPTYATVVGKNIIQPVRHNAQTPANPINAIKKPLICKIDTSKVEEEDLNKAEPGPIRAAIESEVQKKENRAGWKCKAVIKEHGEHKRIRILCQDEEERYLIKEAVEKIPVRGLRLLRDQWYPLRIDNVNRTAVLDNIGNIKTGSIDTLGKENDVQIAKIAWLSDKLNGKTYGSMLIYLVKEEDATRLLKGNWFNAGGESANIKPFEYRYSPPRCYTCQELGHMAFSKHCSKVQKCGKCAAEGHNHEECMSEILKCVPCGGPHESYSKNCARTHPKSNINV
jgi:hypothetical protein